jgi:hypothetical protein
LKFLIIDDHSRIGGHGSAAAIGTLVWAGASCLIFKAGVNFESKAIVSIFFLPNSGSMLGAFGINMRRVKVSMLCSPFKFFGFVF